MVIYPYLVNNGYVLYKDIIVPYFPLTLFLLSIFANFFGYQPALYQILTIGIILIIELLLFTISLKMSKNFLKALITTAFFVVLAIPFGTNGLWFDLILTPLVILSIYFFYDFIKRGKKKSFTISLIFLSLSFFIKQQIAFLAGVYFVTLISNKFGFERRTFSIILKPLVFFLLLLLSQAFLLLKIHALKDAIFWAVFFPAILAPKVPGYLLIPTFKQAVLIVALFIVAKPSFEKKDIKFMIYIFAVALLIFAYPRFDYFHLVPALAALALSFDVSSFKKGSRLKITLMSVSLIYLLIFSARQYLNSWGKEVRFFESDIKQSAKILTKYIPPNEKVYIQNGPDQILPLSGRLPPKPWADEFPWYLEINGVQNRVIEGIENQNAKYVVFQPYLIGSQFILGSYRPKIIADYLESNYKNFTPLSRDLWLKKKN